MAETSSGGGGADASREEKVASCLNILRRTPPQDSEENITGLAAILAQSVDEDASEELYQRADPPLGHAVDTNTADKKAFIISDYNRDGDSYRSPWSNAYYPPPRAANGEDEGGGDEGTFQPSPWLRQIEMNANELFDSYRSLYYGSDDASVSSVYLWDTDGATGNGGFAGAFLIKKEIKEEDGDRYLKRGLWNSIHVVEVAPSSEGRTASYGMTTTISLSMDPNASTSEAQIRDTDSTNVAGTITRRTERVCPLTPTGDSHSLGSQHIANIGSMIEDAEIRSMDSLNIQKTRYVIDSIRSSASDSGVTGGGMPKGAAVRKGGVALSNQHKVATMLTEAVLARQGNK
mmetsp:Transcript_2932/g.6795  ORF Transcript_2932/g.6795 Transcript_2932/m.6795 type:complete len:347 (-) Transcript_2932:43-1083(-)